jgi:hypothetical protein
MLAAALMIRADYPGIGYLEHALFDSFHSYYLPLFMIPYHNYKVFTHIVNRIYDVSSYFNLKQNALIWQPTPSQ